MRSRGTWGLPPWSSSCCSRGRRPCCRSTRAARRGTWRSTCCRRSGTPCCTASCRTAPSTSPSTLQKRRRDVSEHNASADRPVRQPAAGSVPHGLRLPPPGTGTLPPLASCSTSSEKEEWYWWISEHSVSWNGMGIGETSREDE
jgi:hypothetical protein